MLMHKTKTILVKYVLLSTILVIAMAGCAIAGEQNNAQLAQLFEAMARLPQSEESLRRGKNADRLLKALGNLPLADQNADAQQKIANTLQAFSASLDSDEKETKDILQKWNNYLISINRCSNTEHFQVLKSQQNDYYQAIADLEAGIRKSNQLRKDYSASWIDDLVNLFGKSYLKTNRDAILSNFMAIIQKDYHLYKKELKSLIYTEAMLYGSYRAYFKMFIDFNKEKLNADEQKRLASRVEVADAFLAVIDDVSMTSMHNRSLKKGYTKIKPNP